MLLGHLSPFTVGVARMALGALVLIGWLVATDQLGDLAAYDTAQFRCPLRCRDASGK